MRTTYVLWSHVDLIRTEILVEVKSTLVLNILQFSTAKFPLHSLRQVSVRKLQLG